MSVVISTLDRPERLARCLDALLSGDRLPDEIVVVDQGDADRTAGIITARSARGVPLVHLPQRRRGVSVSQNAGVAAARSDLVAVVDDDCIAASDWLAEIVRLHTAVNGPVLLTGRVLPQPPVGDRVVPISSRTSLRPATFDDRSASWDVGTGGNFAVTRAAYLAVGGNDERLGTGSPGLGGNDLDLFRRLLRAGVVGRYEPTLVVEHERGTVADHRSRRWSYGFGLGAALALWWRDGDPLARPLAWQWFRLRAGRVRRHPRWSVVRDELRVLAGTVAGFRHGLRVARLPSGRTGTS
ncbi:MAG: glycosyltransferase family 2 protein [Jatrophihabitans sp.]|uniref:glycosyltransferase family 2 protein n=1 Tax=Jatrophihabitans sp. TaxID=1932789 RepID=UPI003F80A3E5